MTKVVYKDRNNNIHTATVDKLGFRQLMKSLMWTHGEIISTEEV